MCVFVCLSVFLSVLMAQKHNCWQFRRRLKDLKIEIESGISQSPSRSIFENTIAVHFVKTITAHLHTYPAFFTYWVSHSLGQIKNFHRGQQLYICTTLSDKNSKLKFVHRAHAGNPLDLLLVSVTVVAPVSAPVLVSFCPYYFP